MTDMATRVEVIRANANEDQLQLIEVHVADGQKVAKGDLLFILETSKAAVEIEAPAAGYVHIQAVRVGEFVTVGDLLCEISEAPPEATGGAGSLAVAATAEVVVTAKARKLAADNGINLDTVSPVNNRIGEAEVLSAMARGRAGAPRSDRRLTPQDGATAGSRRAVIIGGGGHAACLIDALEGAGYELVGCLDGRVAKGNLVYRGVRVIGTEDELERLRASGVDYAFVGIGGAESSVTRRRFYERAAELGYVLPPVLHPRALIAADAVIGAGCHVLMGASIGPRCTIGQDVIVNQGSIVCHDSRVEDHAHVTPGAILAGGVSIGQMSIIGMGATVLYGVAIGENCLVHNGAQVNNNVEDDTVVDARGIRSRR